ncbi:hypothetical protein M2454_002046 [Aequitasia blattaphilus]|uniref:C39 family peptidase n=1 Tax=Aequitasia blattaphilus TaxID=2949332 RepID=A0ABT1EA96_9FIRM|nr:C39 family peptidase [Aequitasia blattaphilus]MCP1102732.1 C39 family peptidase [Aequitasia blattaphilus]MCR8615372.1 C39 family peptidase [Aequitasia blattaphilus]
MNEKRKQQVLRHKIVLATLGIVVIILGSVLWAKKSQKNEKPSESSNVTAAKTIQQKTQEKTTEERIEEARQLGIEKGYPESLMEAFEMNPQEVLPLVEQYEKLKDQEPVSDIGSDYIEGSIPTLYQWDERWGLASYGSSLLVRAGCGPTALSMVMIYVTGDPSFVPSWVAGYSMQRGLVDEDNLTLWQLMRVLPEDYGITVTEGHPSDEEWVKNTLNEGHPIICSMGPGDFTGEGHFIVVTEYKEDGTVVVHDPFRKVNTIKEWKYADIIPQINAIWAYN